MADFIQSTPDCLPAEIYRLYMRILAGLLLGNTDMHFKNFAMFHTDQGLRLTPSYDQVAAQVYGYKTIALTIAGARNLVLGNLKPKHLIGLAEEFHLSYAAVKLAYDSLAKHKEAAKQAVADAPMGTAQLKRDILTLMDKRWNATFALIGTHSLKKR
jgi:serine/threonine-protein kinase HipA